jgi:dinuclear metal center YbgI/SA1388 family protein
VRVAELAGRFDERLRVAAFADLDPSTNGLQVGDGEATVEHAAFAVDAAMATIEAASAADADVLCVHHGLIWDGLDRVTDRTYDRLAALVRADLALYAAHLPLDAHPELGNAAGVADRIGLDEVEAFGELGTETVGLAGALADGPVAREALADRLHDGLGDPERDVRTLAFGPEAIETVGVVTGSGADWLDEAATAGLDALVTGEGKHSLYHRAREAGVNVLLGGHYATETFGVASLQSLAEEWGLETTFVDHPTGF